MKRSIVLFCLSFVLLSCESNSLEIIPLPPCPVAEEAEDITGIFLAEGYLTQDTCYGMVTEELLNLGEWHVVSIEGENILSLDGLLLYQEETGYYLYSEIFEDEWTGCLIYYNIEVDTTLAFDTFSGTVRTEESYGNCSYAYACARMWDTTWERVSDE